MEPVLISIAGALAVSIISGVVISLLRRKWRKNDANTEKELVESENRLKKIEEDLIKLRKHVWRLEKNATITSKIVDDQTEKYHPELVSSLQDITNELLKESE